MAKNLRIVVAVLLAAILQGQAAAQEKGRPSIIIRGREDVTVTTPSICLGDVADVASDLLKDDDTVIGLRKLEIQKSPAPGKMVTLSAAQVLDALRTKGIDLSSIGYVLPHITTVKRAGRALSENEVKAVIEAVLNQTGRDALIKQVRLPQGVQVPTSDIALTAVPLAATQPGHIAFNMKAGMSGEPDTSFQVEALVDEFKNVPVARRQMVKGEVVGNDDVVMARMNLAQLPRGAASVQENVVGLKLGQDVQSGEAFRIDKLAVPPLVESGSRVILVYRHGALEATATGTALGSGVAGQLISVKNETSKRIVSGTITDSGVVEVRP